MIIQFYRLKHILLKYFRNVDTYIRISGVIDTNLCIEKAKLLVDKRKITLSDGENKNFIIDLDFIDKVKIVNEWHILLLGKNVQIDMQV